MFRSLREEMDDLFNQLTMGIRGEGNGLSGAFVPSMDLAETENTLELKMDLPGLKPDEVQIEVTGDRLRISGEHKEEQEKTDKRFHRVERSQRSFFRVIDLPCAINQQEIAADMKDGVLTVTLPKCEEAKSHKIAVKG